VDSVLIDADIVGWATTISNFGDLDHRDRSALRRCRDDLEVAIDLMPSEARPFYLELLRIANLAVSIVSS
jgi:hypothetical protein